jgi:hypothetical protein
MLRIMMLYFVTNCHRSSKRGIFGLVLLLTCLVGIQPSFAQSFVPAEDSVGFTVSPGTNHTFDVVITDLAGHAITVSGGIYGNNSSLWHLSPSSITIGDDTTSTGHFEISFNSSNTGTYSASLRLYDSVSKTLVYVTLHASVPTPPSPQLHVYPSTYANTTVGTTVCHPVYLYPVIDSGIVTVTNVQFIHSSSVWSLNMGNVSLPSTLTHGHTDTVTVCYSPTTIGDAIDTLEVTYSDTNDSSHTILTAISGSGYVPSPLHVSVGGSFTGDPVGTMLCQNVYVYAVVDSGTALTLNSVALNTSSSVWSINDDHVTLPATLGRSQLDTITVCFDPTSTGDYRDSLVFSYTTVLGTSQILYVPIVGSATSPCFHFGGDTSSAFGVITAGDTQSRTLEIANPNSAAWIITGDSSMCDNGVWTINGITFPDTIAANSTTHFNVLFTAPSATTNERYACSFIFYGNSGSSSCEKTLNVRGYSRPDTSKVQLQPDTTQTIAFHQSLPGSTYKIVQIYNNSGHVVRIESFSLTNTTNFSVSLYAPDSTLPFHISGDGSFYLKITLNDTNAGTYNDTLIVVTDDNATSLSIRVNAVVTPMTETVELPKVQSFAIAVNPNPSHGQFTVSMNGMQHATVQVLDLLGRVVSESRNVSNSWTISGSGLAGQALHTGVYIVRATGVLANGRQVTGSTRVAITR